MVFRNAFRSACTGNDSSGCRVSKREMQGCRFDWYREFRAESFDLLNSGEDLRRRRSVLEMIPAGQHAVMVTVFADSAAKYLSERFWDED